MDDIAEFSFVVDILITFLTSYLDHNGRIVSDLKIIAKHYVKSTRFVFDLLSVFANLPGLYVFGVFKLIRIRRIDEFIKKLTLPK